MTLEAADSVEIFFLSIGILALLSLLYLNLVATIIVCKIPGSAGLIKLVRSVFVWLIPIIGFAFTLRFTQQTDECSLHYRLLPKFVQNWIYDDRFVADNPNADHNWRRGLMLDRSDRIDRFRGKF